MKKFISIALIAVTMMFMLAFSAFAEISPTAEPMPNDPTTPGGSAPGNDSPTSPQTSDVAVYVGFAALLVAAGATVLAVKKVKQ